MGSSVYSAKVLEVEPFGVESIPQAERHGKSRQMFSIWFAINLNIVTWFTGFLGIAFGLSIKYSVIAIIIGNVAGAAFLALSASLGPSLGRPLIPASRRAFGKAGVIGLAFLNLINNIGWLGVNLLLAVMALQKIVPLNYYLAVLVLTAVTLLVAIFGHNFIHAFARWMSIVMGLLFVALSVITIVNMKHVVVASATTVSGFDWGMFILTISVVFAYQISYCPIGTDYARYLPNSTPRKNIWHFSFWGALIVCVWLEILGALTATLGTQVGPMDFIEQIMGVFTIPALITVVLSILPVNAMAMYSGGLATLAMGLPLKRWISAILIALIGAVLILFNSGELTEHYTNFLLLLSYWIVPWFCIMYFDSSRRNGDLTVQLAPRGWLGVIAFASGILISVPFMHSNLYVGVVAKQFLGGADVSYLISSISSVLIYHLMLSSRSLSPAAISGSHQGRR